MYHSIYAAELVRGQVLQQLGTKLIGQQIQVAPSTDVVISIDFTVQFDGPVVRPIAYTEKKCPDPQWPDVIVSLLFL